ncbi:recombinase family protein, partial [Acinetobacter baumannii]
LIFDRYLELKSVHRLVQDLGARGVVSKRRTTKDGRTMGGVPFTRGPLFHLLRSRTYLGEVPHKDTSYPGQHPAIIDRETFDRVQALLDASA